MNDNNVALEVLKWIGLAFAAGFIGYFGRYLSILIIERARKKRTGQAPAKESIKAYTGETPVSPVDQVEIERLKLEKKRLKLEKKKAKKG